MSIENKNENNYYKMGQNYDATMIPYHSCTQSLDLATVITITGSNG